jgi:hypothetical protein
VSDKVRIIQEDEDVPVYLTDAGVRVLEQDFQIPEGDIPVRMQVGDLPVSIVGWIAPGDGNLADLLENVAAEVRKIEAER